MAGIRGLQELRKGADGDLKRITDEQNVGKAVQAVVESYRSHLAMLREHVDGLVKGGGGSMADLELVAAGIRVIEELGTSDAEKVKSAVLTGTGLEGIEGEAEAEADAAAIEAEADAAEKAAAEEETAGPRTKRREQTGGKKS